MKVSLLLVVLSVYFEFSSPARILKQKKLNLTQVDGEYEKEASFLFDSATEVVLVYPESRSKNPFRIKAWTNSLTSSKFPVIVVVRQEQEVLSWQLPFLVDTSKRDEKIRFDSTARTLCHNNMEKIVKTMKRNSPPIQITQSFIVALSTSSPRMANVSVVVEEERDFYVEANNEYNISVSPSETRYVYYRFADNTTDTVLVHLNSNDDVCLTVSVQDSFCPVFDLDKDITYDGKYQTVNRKGGLSIRRKDFPEGFFLVFVAKGDNYACSQESSFLPMPKTVNIYSTNRTSLVSFKIVEDINGKDYGRASAITLGAICIFYFTSLFMVIVFTKWGAIGKLKKNGTVSVDECDAEIPVIQATAPTSGQITELLRCKDIPLKKLAQYPEIDYRRSYNYLWHILSIAIFYSIPVVQLVFTYQRTVNQTGNQDMCYYNFLCAHPAFGLSDFNHVFSNIGYVFIGILYLLVSYSQRHLIIKSRPGRGIPVHNGLYYAMGIALIIEGLLSACYHICPSQSNYQFDTSFMYVMAVLCMVKLYQNRHPDINATAYATFTVLGIAISLAMIGILNGSLTIWIVFAVTYAILSTYISFKIYFLSYIVSGFNDMRQEIRDEGFHVTTLLKPMRKMRFCTLVIANLLNYAMLVGGLLMYDYGVTDFGTFLLALLMGNAVLHTIFYSCMKLVNGERICLEAIIYGILMILSWGSSAVFFLDTATLWTVTPAESRQKNTECILLNFYDSHDIWHLISAPALYYSFMYLQCLDDDLLDKNQDEIIVF